MRWHVVSCLRWDAAVLLLLGITVGLPTTVLPALQADVFSQPFLVAGALVGVKGILNTALAPAVGAMADRSSSHKRLLAVSLALLTLPFAAVLLIPSQGEQVLALQVWSFSLTDAVLGLSSVGMSLCFAVVPERLGQEEAVFTEGYSLLNFAFTSGVGLGSVLGALGDFAACAKIGFIVTSANTLATACMLPRTAAGGQAPHQQVLREAATPSQALALLRGNSTLLLLAIVVFLDFLAEQMLVSLLLLYLQVQFHLDSLHLGCQLAIVGLSASASLLFVVPRLKPVMGDLSLMQLGMVANVLSVGLFAFVWEPWQAFLPPLGCLFSFAVFPTVNAMAAAVSPRNRGAMAQGLISGSRTLAESVSPVIFGWMFQIASKSSMPGWPFLLGAGCVAVGLCVSCLISPKAPELAVGSAACGNGSLLADVSSTSSGRVARAR